MHCTCSDKPSHGIDLTVIQTGPGLDITTLGFLYLPKTYALLWFHGWSERYQTQLTEYDWTWNYKIKENERSQTRLTSQVQIIKLYVWFKVDKFKVNSCSSKRSWTSNIPNLLNSELSNSSFCYSDVCAYYRFLTCSKWKCSHMHVFFLLVGLELKPACMNVLKAAGSDWLLEFILFGFDYKIRPINYIITSTHHKNTIKRSQSSNKFGMSTNDHPSRKE